MYYEIRTMGFILLNELNVRVVFFSIAFITVSLFSLALINQIDAATYFVSPSGNNSNSGTQSSPWRTIQKSVNEARSGDTVNVLAGTYSEDVEFTQHSGVNGSPITFKKLGSGDVIVQASSWAGLFFGDGVSFITIDGFIFKDAPGNGVLINHASNITITNCESYGAKVGILIYGSDGPIDNITVSHCKVHDNEAEGIYYTVRPPQYYPISNGIIEFNEVYDNGSDGIQNTHPTQPLPAPNGTMIRGNILSGNGEWAEMDLSGNNLTVERNIIYGQSNAHIGGIWYANGSGTTIKNNLVYNISGDGSDGNDAGITINNASNTQVYHNTVHNHRSVSMRINSNKSGIEVVNNILSSSNEAQLERSSSQTVVNNNLLFGNSIGTEGTNAILADPNFTDPTMGDFIPKSGSPAIDSGVSLDVTQDLRAFTRPVGIASDLGAIEVQGVDDGGGEQENFCVADLNEDGEVNIADFEILAINYNKDNISCDLDITGNNCRLDILDFVVFAMNYEKDTCQVLGISTSFNLYSVFEARW
jgi:hypothetical protein